ncbi:WcaI family glycosyltransferase [uncultured Caulobacter sp.]|uniref:WcaI family glycosyltransferase n=1 Tax=uncultured Caulobacter sp. TaxID=158749 RepID=UPI002610E7B0|nr:WcaI family glycosyltransferase [uncultured Caulobacter sp.]
MSVVGKLRVLIIALNYAPELVGCAKYTTELAEELARRGHEVEVISGPPYYPTWAVYENYSATKWYREEMNGVQLHRTPLYVPADPSGLKRIIHLASFALAALPPALRVAKRLKPHVVFSVAPTLTSASVALTAGKFSGAFTWLHVQDFEVDAAFDLGIVKSNWLKGAALSFETWLLKAFDRVSSISPAMVDRLKQKGVEHRRVREFRNWVDVDQVQVVTDPNTAYRRELGILPHEIVALYSGNMASKQGLEALAEVATRLTEHAPPVQLVLCGDGPAKPALEQACRGLPNVKFLSLQPLERLSELLGTADIHLLPQRAEAADLVLPSKLTGMLASGRPVVAMAAAGTGLYAEVEGCGINVPPDASAMTCAILELAQDPKRRILLGVAARERAESRWRKSTIIDGFEAEVVQWSN